MKGNGEMIFSMVMAWKHGLTTVSIKESMLMGRNKEKGVMGGLTEVIMMVNGKIIRLMVMVSTGGQMEEDIKVR